jgi:hypothetical protein
VLGPTAQPARFLANRSKGTSILNKIDVGFTSRRIRNAKDLTGFDRGCRDSGRNVTSQCAIGDADRGQP